MKNIQTSLTAAAITAALSLPLAGVALADTSPAVNANAPVMLANNDTMDNAEGNVSDTWITTKVKSTLLSEGSTPGMDIKVETNKGVVSLSGTVATDAEREMAITKTKGIKGVRDVSADGLKSAE